MPSSVAMDMDTEVAALPDDALAKIFRRLPARSLAEARRVCKAWRAVVDVHELLLPYRRLLPHRAHGFFINYIDHRRPHLFARPATGSSGEIESLLGFLPSDLRNWWSVLDHCRGLLLCNLDWYNQLCVCNPATQGWALLPRRAGATRGDYAGAYLAFDPAASLHYEVYLTPNVLEKEPLPPSVRRRKVEQGHQEEIDDGPFWLDYLFSSSYESIAIAREAEAATEEEEELNKELPSMDEDNELVDIDQRHSMEWPPTPWILKVFSSRTSRWEERAFVREGNSAGTIQDMGLDQPQPIMRGPRQCYAVYWQGALYIHCRGDFITRLSLSNKKFQVIKTPGYIKSDPHAKPYLGRSEKGVYFGIVQWCQLWVWTLNESCGETEWTLNCNVDLTRYAQHIAEYGRQMDAPWILHDDNVSGIIHNDHDSGSQTLAEERFEWDSDNEDFFTADKAAPAEEFYDSFDIVGFHPYKEIVFLAKFFSITAYHLNTSRIQYLGNSRPRSYYRNYTNDIYESFVYTPCMIREFNEGSIDWSGSS